MINRYCTPEMTRIWSDKHKYALWLSIEWAVCEELHRQKIIKGSEWTKLKTKITNLIENEGIEGRDVEKVEEVTRHDVIAFTTVVAKKLGVESRYIHYGLTSSDVVDTALSLLILESLNVVKTRIKELLSVLKDRAIEFQSLPTIGRSHGMFAEPTSFGLKFLGWYTEWERNLQRLNEAEQVIRVGKLSGAVGTNAHWNLEEESRILKSLGLRRETVATQVVPRDRHSQIAYIAATFGSSLERIAIELRHLQRSEVQEVREGFRAGQKGSSAMPHKRNPISSENITGVARLLRSYLQASLENIALWHERDISHSSVERVLFPDSFQLLDYALKRMTQVLRELQVLPDQVAKNLERAGETIFSGNVLLALVQKGVRREDAYRWVQECAMKSSEPNAQPRSLLSELNLHPEVRKYLSSFEIERIMSIKHQTRNVGQIYKYAFKKS